MVEIDISHLAAVWVLGADDGIVAAANPVPILIKMAIKLSSSKF